MRGIHTKALVAVLALAAAACSETTAPNTGTTDVVAAFNTTLASFGSTENSFDGADSIAWHPRGHGGRGHIHRGPRRGLDDCGFGPGFGGLMGGGLRGLFLGRGFGHGRGGFALPSACTFNAATGRVECPPVTNDHGLTITRSASYTTASGGVQQAFDSLTDQVNLQIAVNGTFISRRDSAQTTVRHSSSRTIGGLAVGSTERTINGVSAGSESTTGQDTAGSYTLLRVAGDTINGVVIPVRTDSMGATYPTAGTIIRSMTATLTRGTEVRTSSRREVLTFNGSANAILSITQNGITRSCTISLALGRPNCS
jgi:hypothetical protein